VKKLRAAARAGQDRRSSPVELDRLRQALGNIKRRLDVVAGEAGESCPKTS